MQLAGTEPSPARNPKAKFPCKAPAPPPAPHEGKLGEGNLILWRWLLLNCGLLVTVTPALPHAACSEGQAVGRAGLSSCPRNTTLLCCVLTGEMPGLKPAGQRFAAAGAACGAGARSPLSREAERSPLPLSCLFVWW